MPRKLPWMDIALYLELGTSVYFILIVRANVVEFHILKVLEIDLVDSLIDSFNYLSIDVGFLNDKIGQEQRRIRQRERLEEERTRESEARRTWLQCQIRLGEKRLEVIRQKWVFEEKFLELIAELFSHKK